MSNIRDLTGKINSLQNMQKVMRAMNMIASIKLRKLYAVQDPLSLFSKTVDDMYLAAAGILSGSDHPVVKGYKEVSRAHVVLFTADKGLCGTHNSSVQKALEGFTEEHSKEGIETEVTCIGNKGIHFCNRKGIGIFQQSEISEKVFRQSDLQRFSESIVDRFLENRIQKVVVIGNVFYSTLNQETVVRQLLPVFIPPEKREKLPEYGGVGPEPEGELLAETFSRRYLYFKLKDMLLNSYLSEHSSRMTAMENATNNSEDLINKYVSMQNHARQAAITNELIEIVSGKEALKG